jgi:hypothetical protein
MQKNPEQTKEAMLKTCIDKIGMCKCGRLCTHGAGKKRKKIDRGKEHMNKEYVEWHETSDQQALHCRSR